MLLVFWRLEILNQGTSKAILSLKPLEKPSLTLFNLSQSWVLLARSCITPLSASVLSWASSLCVSASFYLNLLFSLTKTWITDITADPKPVGS